MPSLFWAFKEPIVEHYMSRRLVNSNSYCDLLENHFILAIKSKRRSLLTLPYCCSTIMRSHTWLVKLQRGSQSSVLSIF